MCRIITWTKIIAPELPELVSFIPCARGKVCKRKYLQLEDFFVPMKTRVNNNDIRDMYVALPLPLYTQGTWWYVFTTDRSDIDCTRRLVQCLGCMRSILFWKAHDKLEKDFPRSKIVDFGKTLLRNVLIKINLMSHQGSYGRSETAAGSATEKHIKVLRDWLNTW